MDQQLKELIISVRRAMPTWAYDANVSIVLKVKNQGDVCVEIVGTPPLDETSIRYGNRYGKIVRNWGAEEIHAMIDTPENIAKRREQLKEYDNKNKSTRWGNKDKPKES